MPDSSHLAVALVCFATGALATAAYLDYKRGNEAHVHPRGRRHRRSGAVPQAGFSLGIVSTKLLREALLQVKQEELPKTPEHREAYFVTQVGVGELLVAQGPEFHLSAAIAFFKALRIHPMPMDLVMIYQSHVPEPIFKLVMDLMYLDGHPPLIPNTRLAPSWNRSPHRWHRLGSQPSAATQPRFSFSSSSPHRSPVSRVRPLRVGGKAGCRHPLAIAPTQQILHRALRDCKFV